MNGVKFGELHSYTEWGLMLSKKEIGSPTVKEKKVEIEGADGELDFTEALGGVKFNNRTLKFTFKKGKMTPDSVLSLVSDIQDAIHGKKLKVTLDEDADWYYYGRIKVADFTLEKTIGTVVIEVDAEPYKLAQQLTTVSTTVDGNSQNIYDTSKITLVSTAIKLQEDDFFEVDAVNNGDAWQYITFFHNVFSAGEITPNQNVTIMLETKDFAISGTTGNVFFHFTSHTPTAPDYFAPSNYSTRLSTHDRKTQALYPAAIKNETTIAAATYFIRSFISLAPADRCKGKFRLSILSGDVKTTDFVYTSHDGTMKGLQLFNTKKRAVLTIMASSAFDIYFEENTFSVSAGTTVIPELELKEGINDVAVKGTGTISFTWQEGRL